MTSELFAALVGYAFVKSITPGPNNIMVFASGANFGFRRTIPHLLGISAGFIVLTTVVGLGLGQLLTANPALYAALRLAALAYVLWLAWRIATTAPSRPDDASADARPMTFLEAALFQWLNPKAWFGAITGVAVYTDPSAFMSTLAILVAVFAVANFVSTAFWTGMGMRMARWLEDPKRLRVFNIAMALLLLASVWPIARDLL